MNKYYTPELEEFHIGFEYEFCGMSVGGVVFIDASSAKDDVVKTITPPSVKVWQKELFVNDIIFCINPDKIERLIKSGQIRVKHLDREDLDSLDWEYFKEVSYAHVFRIKVDYSKLTINEGSDSWLYVDLMKDGGVRINNDAPYEDYDGVYLNIKNKSEFKRLMKQLGI